MVVSSSISVSVVIIPPDTSGSKGDEAIVRGALNVFEGASITILSPGNRELSWKSELSDRANDFFEDFVPSNNISEYFVRSCFLAILGTDVIDGTGSKLSSISRLEAIEKNSQLDGMTAVFMSFRKNVDEEIIKKIKEVEEGKIGDIIWTCRDRDSINNFEEQTGIKCRLFPDFAFYSENQQSERVIKISDQLRKLREDGKAIIGVNISSHSFSSFYDYTRDNVDSYIHSVIDPICETEDDPFFVLISHDTRNVLGGLPSDFDFAHMANQIIQKESLVLPRDLKYPELQSIIHDMDYVVTGRMHICLSSFFQNVLPFVFTGKGRASFSMVDKCYGMFEDRVGRKDLVATNVDELKKAINVIKTQKEEIRDAIIRNNSINKKIEEDCLDDIRTILKPELRNEFKVEMTEYGILVQAIRETVQDIRSDSDDLNNRCTEIDDYCRKLNDYCDGLQWRIHQLECESKEQRELLQQHIDKSMGTRIRNTFKRLFKRS